MKRYRYGLFFLTVILGAFALYRCFADRRPDRKEPESVRIGITLYRDDDTFINSICRILETEAKKYEKTEGIRMILDVMDAKEDQNTQNSQVDRFLALGCDVICVNMVDRSAASVIIDKAMDREVPVIFFNREPVSEDLNRWEKLFYVGANPKEEGVCQGNMIADAYDACPEILDLNGDGKVSYVILEGERGHQDSLMRTEWAVQTLKNRGVDLEKLTGGIANWQRSQADALMGQWLEKFPEQIELVLSNNDDMALGAIDTLRRLGIIRPVCVAGIDGTPAGLDAVESGLMLGTVVIDRETYGKTMMRMALSLAETGRVPEDISLERGAYFRCPSYPEIRKRKDETPETGKIE